MPYTETEIVTTRKGFRYSTPVAGTLTGRGGNIIIIDDPIKQDDVLSKAGRNSVNQWYDNTVYSRLDNKQEDVIIIVMQRVHQDDLVGHVIDKEDWVRVDIPAIAEERARYLIGPDEYHYRQRGDVLHPERENRESLENTRRTIGSYNFSAQYQQKPVPPEGNLVKENWLRSYGALPDRSSFDGIVQSWDTASSGDELGDYSVCTTWGVRGQEYYLIDVIRERLEYPDLKRRLLQEAERHRAHYVLIERAGSGLGLFQELRRRDDLRHLHFQGCLPKEDKETRLSVQSAKFEAGQVYLPKTAPWLGEFVEELLAFPGSRHDDQVDSVTQFLRWIGRQETLLKPGVRPQGRDRPQGYDRPAGRPFPPSRRLRPGWPQIF